MTIVTEKRLYETPAGELVEELEDSGSLFCGVGAELTGPEAERYLAYCGAAPEAVQALHEGTSVDAEKAAPKPANKGAPKAKNKGA